MSRQPGITPSISELPVLFQEVGLPNAVCEALARTQQRVYQRIFTAQVVVWLWIYQRLNPDHTCDAAVSYVSSGALDGLDDRHAVPLSQRLRSESSAAYCQARQRLPLAIWPALLSHIAQSSRQLLPDGGLWHGHPVGLLDGTTLLMRPEPALVAHYGQASNGKQTGYWAMMRIAVLFCLVSGALLGLAEGPYNTSEQALAEALFVSALPNSIYVADANFGVFSVVQAAFQRGIWLLVRLQPARARAILKRQRLAHLSEDVQVCWQPSAQECHAHPEMDPTPIPGRLLHVWLTRPGFRPMELYLFTTLLNAELYPLECLVELYGLRWHVELDLRYVKSTLDLDLVNGKSVDIVRKDLYAGLVGYNLIRWHMVKAACLAAQPSLALSFTRCWRRIRNLFSSLRQTNARARTTSTLLSLWHSLARCVLPPRQRWRLEPRKVRATRRGYPILKGSRAAARDKELAKLHEPPKS